MSAAAPKQPMSVFNQAAEDRLKELLEKRKRDKLTGAEALEVRELRLLKAKAQQAKERAAIEQARRQLVDRDRYRLGGLSGRQFFCALADAMQASSIYISLHEMCLF